MQVLKESIRERIEESAIKLFRKNGFERVSMRAIAKESHMTVGNIYRYYDNKDHLFESITLPTLRKIVGLIDDEVTKNLVDHPEKNTAFVLRIIDIFLAIHQENAAVLDILINSCEGSTIDLPKKTISDLLAVKMTSLITSYQGTIPTTIDAEFLAKMICDSLIENYIKILYQFDEDSKRRTHMYLITQMYTNMFINQIISRNGE